jgi:ribosome biogenesis SPOUT family RNA methylase Rps3
MEKIYIIEHLEPKLWKWCLIEYENISKLVGEENLWFTNIKKNSDKLKLRSFGKVFGESVRSMGLTDVCVLDPEAEKTLSNQDSEKFNYFIFGGILGDYPPKKRTKEELTKFISNPNIRNIGKEQMSTDNAVFTVKEILSGRKFEDLKFQENVSIEINEFESIDLPYRYNIVDGKPFISRKIIDYLKKKKTF